MIEDKSNRDRKKAGGAKKKELNRDGQQTLSVHEATQVIINDTSSVPVPKKEKTSFDFLSQFD